LEREDEEEDISCYFMTLRKRDVTGNRKRKHYMARGEQLALEEVVVVVDVVVVAAAAAVFVLDDDDDSFFLLHQVI